MKPRNDGAIDARLKAALHHAPDANVVPSKALDELILSAARRDASTIRAHAAANHSTHTSEPPSVAWIEWLRQAWRTPMAMPALGALAMATLVVTLWRDQTLPSPMADREMPAASAPSVTDGSSSKTTAKAQPQPMPREVDVAMPAVEAQAKPANVETAPSIARASNPISPRTQREPSVGAGPEAASRRAPVPVPALTPALSPAPAPVTEPVPSVAPTLRSSSPPAQAQTPLSAQVERRDEGQASVAPDTAREYNRDPRDDKRAAARMRSAPAMGASDARQRAAESSSVGGRAASPPIAAMLALQRPSADGTMIGAWRRRDASDPAPSPPSSRMRAWLQRLQTTAQERWRLVDSSELPMQSSTAITVDLWWRTDSMASVTIDGASIHWFEPDGRHWRADVSAEEAKALRDF